MKQLTVWVKDKKQLDFAIELLEEGGIKWEYRPKKKAGKIVNPVKYAIFRTAWEEVTDK